MSDVVAEESEIVSPSEGAASGTELAVSDDAVAADSADGADDAVAAESADGADVAAIDDTITSEDNKLIEEFKGDINDLQGDVLDHAAALEAYQNALSERNGT